MLRAGGWISAGMISVVQMPLPVRAAIAPSDWPQRCAPSPESLMTSTMCSSRTAASRATAADGFSVPLFAALAGVTVSFMGCLPFRVRLPGVAGRGPSSGS